MENISVKIKFVGPIAVKMGMKEQLALIRGERKNGIEDINRIIKERAGDQILFMILINGSSIDLNHKLIFDPNDVFSVVPIVLGG
jgi:hypothetical protein